jgi:drug/metabolite transporter (DMT)-like permease
VGLDYLPPFLFAGIRFATATASLLVIMRLLHAKMPRDGSSWVVMLFLGVFQIALPYGLVFWGEQYISSGLSALLFATMPFFVVLFARVLAGDKLTRLKVVGVVVAFVGLIFIFWKDLAVPQSSTSDLPLFGDLALICSSASCALASVVAKQHANAIDPAANVLVQTLTGAVALTSLGFLTENGLVLNFTSASVLAILYLGVVGSALAFVGMYWLLKRTTATNVSLITFITPVLALLLGWAVLQEILDLNAGLGAVLILAGVYLTIRPEHRLRS